MMKRVCMYANFMGRLVPALFPMAASPGLGVFLDSSVGVKIAPTPFCSRGFFALELFPKNTTPSLFQSQAIPASEDIERGDQTPEGAVLCYRGALRITGMQIG